MTIMASICDHIFDFHINSHYLASCVESLLKKNIVHTKSVIDPFVVEIMDEYEAVNDEQKYIEHIKTKKASIFLNYKKAVCFVDENKIKSAESLYYQLINPLIIKVMQLKNLLYVHGAAMQIEKKGISVIGHRNAGKTTLSLITLLQGEKVLTDDCLFINECLEAQSFYRPLHVNPNLGSILNIEKELEQCKPYLHDEVELNYDIDLFHPKQMAAKLKLESIFFSHVKNIQSTNIEKLTDKQKKDKLIDYINENGGLPNSLENVFCAMLDLPMYDLHLGNDILENPKIIKSFTKY